MNPTEILKASAGKFVSVDFVKQDGTPRTVTGKLAPLSPSMGNRKQYINIMLAGPRPESGPAYRNVTIDTIKAIRIDGKTYNFTK